MTRQIIISNRTPGTSTAAGGLAVALRKVLNERDGFWFGWTGEFASDPSDEAQFRDVGGITVGGIDLTRDEHHAYYEGFSNSVLWPAFHHRLDLTDMRPEFYEGYRAVNERLATALAPHIVPDDLIWVHDYHLIPLAEALRKHGINNRIGFFLHIPFPEIETLNAIPHHEDLMRAFNAFDLVGLQAERDVATFNDYALNARLGDLAASAGNGRHAPTVMAFPIGTDPAGFAALLETEQAIRTRELVARAMADRNLIIGVDRLDYSKGLPQRFEAYEQLLAAHRDLHREVHFLQIAPPSRDTIPEYQEISERLDLVAGRVMGRFAEPDWAPLNYVKRAYPQAALAGLYNLAGVALVTPLRDGMNLVAHEYVACQDEADPGVLVLSRFAGAAEIFEDALLVNPHDTQETADALYTALRMPLAERQSRWRHLKSVIEDYAVDHWAQRFLTALANGTSTAN